jgi:ATP-dependent DNA ligase
MDLILKRVLAEFVDDRVAARCCRHSETGANLSIVMASNAGTHLRTGATTQGRYSGIANLPVETCIIDGEAIVVDQNGLSVFDLLRYRQHDHAATLCAFDLLELDGADLRSSPVEERKQHLAWALRERHHGIALNATYDGDGAVIYEHACTLGCEGIVSKRLGSPYRAGRTDQWLKMKNPKAPAVRREIDWAKR